MRVHKSGLRLGRNCRSARNASVRQACCPVPVHNDIAAILEECNPDGSDIVVSYVLGIHDSAVKLMARRKGHAVSNGQRHNVDVHAERLVGNIGKDMEDNNGRPLHTLRSHGCSAREPHCSRCRVRPRRSSTAGPRTETRSTIRKFLM